MSDYTFNKAQHVQLLEVISNVEKGIFPVVKINNEIFEECYLETGMLARIVSVSVNNEDLAGDGIKDTCCEFVLDFSDFEDDNQKLESPNWRNSETGEFDLTASEAGHKPEKCRESVYHSITHGEIFFELMDSNPLFKEYLGSGTKVSYVEWLEETLTKLRS